MEEEFQKIYIKKGLWREKYKIHAVSKKKKRNKISANSRSRPIYLPMTARNE